MATVNRFEDIMDSRDIIHEIERLESDKELAQADAEALLAKITELENQDWTQDIGVEINALVEEVRSRRETDSDEKSYFTSDNFSTSDQSDLEDLLKLAEEGENVSSDWIHGEALIRDSYFKEYAEQLAEDIGAITGEEGWPLSYIDWRAAARALQMDYSCIDFAGIDYWIRR